AALHRHRGLRPVPAAAGSVLDAGDRRPHRNGADRARHDHLWRRQADPEEPYRQTCLRPLTGDLRMDFSLTEEQVLLRDSAERFAREHYGLETRRRRIASGANFSPETWGLFADLG